MKLNLDILYDHLPENWQKRRFGAQNRKLLYTRPHLLVSGNKMQPEQLYICATETLPKASLPENCGIICTGSQFPSALRTDTSQILLISEKIDLLTVFQQVHRIYDHLEDWEREILKALADDLHFDLKKIIHLGMLVLENPLSVMDSSMQIIFSSTIQKAEGQNIQITVDDIPYTLSVSERENMKEACQLERMITLPYLSSVKQNSSRVYCCNLISMGFFAGCIWLQESNRPFRESDFALADQFFDYFQQSFCKYMKNFGQKKSPKVAILKSILNHALLDAFAYEHFSLQPSESWQCFRLKGKKDKRYMPKDYMTATLNALFPQTICATIFENHITGIFRQRSDQETTLSLFQDLLKRMDYTAAFSDEFTDIQKADDYFHQADYVLEHCIDENADTCIYRFQDYILRYLLQYGCSSLPKTSLYSKGIQDLIEHDRQKKSDYIKTLDIYLKNEMNVSQTAKQLYIQRSSLIKRLDKIKRILNDPLLDADSRLYYRICFSFLEI